ncbi:four helix bundle protein [Okeania sp. SIO1I7]|uniref:four helix bundle protein n=1 Tax=Okeania sp. SIO1I7 TaxID=2607772 RepID=UPI0025CF66BC|nr:four helix bundle protein [Okeania sp. SIO1I7]
MRRRSQEMEEGVRRQESGDRRWKKELELCFLEPSFKKELTVRMKREPAKNFRDLIVWQKAHQLVLEVYRFSSNFPKTDF